MTQKELLYVEDAIGHETSIIDIINESINNLEDDNLVAFLGKEFKKHVKTKGALMKLLEEKTNEW